MRQINSSKKQRRTEPLRDQVQRDVFRAILNGKLKPGTKIVESRVSAMLKVSRTPLRESLLKLEQEGFVVADEARGFLVAPLTAKEVREIYPILCALECLALETAGLRVAIHLPEMRGINKALAKAKNSPMKAVKLDVQWHNALLQEYPNQNLLKIHSDLRRIANRYERIYMEDASIIPFSVAQHNSIMDALQKKDLEKALEKLKENWVFGMEFLLKQLGSI